MFSIAILWLCISIVFTATCWYFGITLSTLFPTWWKRNVADYDPYYQQMAQSYRQGEQDGNTIILSQPPADKSP
jgi:hypothetical protein